MAEDKKQDASPAGPQARPIGKDVSPSIRLEAFCCPHCGTYAHQLWYKLHTTLRSARSPLPFVPTEDVMARVNASSDIEKEMLEVWNRRYEKSQTGNVYLEQSDKSYSDIEAYNLALSSCYSCDKIAVWVHDRLIHPPQRIGPQPNEDLPEDILKDYEEARSILTLSPRGAAALLRLSVEKLCDYLDAEGENLNGKIASLVTRGLDPRVQKSLDAVRVIGNEAVHPGQMDLDDNPEMVAMLFGLVNLIAEKMISEEKHVDEVYRLISTPAQKAIEKRDKGSKKE